MFKLDFVKCRAVKLQILICSALRSAHFTQGVKAKVQLKLSIFIGAKVEINPPKGFTPWVKLAEIEEKNFNLPPRY